MIRIGDFARLKDFPDIGVCSVLSVSEDSALVEWPGRDPQTIKLSELAEAPAPRTSDESEERRRAMTDRALMAHRLLKKGNR